MCCPCHRRHRRRLRRVCVGAGLPTGAGQSSRIASSAAAESSSIASFAAVCPPQHADGPPSPAVPATAAATGGFGVRVGVGAGGPTGASQRGQGQPGPALFSTATTATACRQPAVAVTAAACGGRLIVAARLISCCFVGVGRSLGTARPLANFVDSLSWLTFPT
jgi:hypothetical protein